MNAIVIPSLKSELKSLPKPICNYIATNLAQIEPTSKPYCENVNTIFSGTLHHRCCTGRKGKVAYKRREGWEWADPRGWDPCGQTKNQQTARMHGNTTRKDSYVASWLGKSAVKL
jgi:hypothetical protein